MGACPRCDAAVAPGQEYCLGCGSRLPDTSGVLPTLSGAWRTRMRWYPGDWVWSALLLFAVAGFATAAALIATEEGTSGARPLVATFDRPAPVTKPRVATSTPAPPRGEQAPGLTTRPATTTTRPRTLVQWPPGRSAYTVVLASYPSTTGQPTATRLARNALRAGLPDVGVLDSSRYPSLHPGYYVVFSGVYESADDAASALAAAQRLGYERAYTRQIVS